MHPRGAIRSIMFWAVMGLLQSLIFLLISYKQIQSWWATARRLFVTSQDRMHEASYRARHALITALIIAVTLIFLYILTD